MSNPKTATDGEHADIMYPSAIPFVLVHLACIAVFWTRLTWQSVAMCALLYWLRIFAISAGYYRYFSHRAYSTSRAFQFALALLSQSTLLLGQRFVMDGHAESKRTGPDKEQKAGPGQHYWIIRGTLLWTHATLTNLPAGIGCLAASSMP